MLDDLSIGPRRYEVESCHAKMDHSQQLELGIWTKAASALKSELDASSHEVDALTAERAVMIRHIESEAGEISSLKDESKCLIATKQRLEFSVQALQRKLKTMADEAENHLALLAAKDREAFKLSELNLSLDKHVRELEERESNSQLRLLSLKRKLQGTDAQLQIVTMNRDCLGQEVEKLQQDALRTKEVQSQQDWERRVSILERKLEEGASQIDALQKERSSLWSDLEIKEAEVRAAKDTSLHVTAAKEMVERSAQALQAKANRLTEENEYYRAGGTGDEAKCWSAQSQEDLQTEVRDLRHRQAVGEQHLLGAKTRLEETAAELGAVVACNDDLVLEMGRLQEAVHAAREEHQRLQRFEQESCSLRLKCDGSAKQIDSLQMEISVFQRDLDITGGELQSVKVENELLRSCKDQMAISIEDLEVQLAKILKELETNKREMEEKDSVTSMLADENANQGKRLKELKEREGFLEQHLDNLKANLENTSEELRATISCRNDLDLKLQMLEKQETCTKQERAQESLRWEGRFSTLEGQLRENASCLDLVKNEGASVLKSLQVTEAELIDVKNEHKRLLSAKDMAESSVESLKCRLTRMNEEAENMRSEIGEKNDRMARLEAQNLDLEKQVKEAAEREGLAEQRVHALGQKLEEVAQELQVSVVTRDGLARERERLQEHMVGMVVEQEERKRSWEQSVSSLQRKANDGMEQADLLQKEINAILRDLKSRETDLGNLKDHCKSVSSAKEALECSVSILQCRLENLVQEAETNKKGMEEQGRDACRLREMNVHLEKQVKEQTEKVSLAEQCIDNLKKKLEETQSELQTAVTLTDSLGQEVQILQEQAGSLKLGQERQSEACEQKLGILQRQIRALETDVDSVRSERAALLKDLECGECELNLLRNENRQLSAAKDAAQVLVQTLQDKLKGTVIEAEANKGAMEEICRNLEVAEEMAATRGVQLDELRVKIENGDRVSERLVAAEEELLALHARLFDADQQVRDKEDSLAASEWTVQHLATEISKAKSCLVQKDKREATLQQQFEDLEMQLRNKEGEIIEIDCYLQQQLKINRQQRAELDELSQKMQESEKGAADWLKLECEMKSQLRSLEDAVEVRDSSLRGLTNDLKVQAETREAMEGAIDSLKVQLGKAENTYCQKEKEMESLCDDLERAREDASVAASQLKDLQSRMQQLDVILGQVAASKEREQDLEKVNIQLQQEATRVEEQNLARKNKLLKAIEQLEKNRAVNRALHVQMTTTHKRFLDELDTCPESCGELWNELAVVRKCKKLRRSGDLSASSRESLSDVLEPESAEVEHIVSSNYTDRTGTTCGEQVDDPSVARKNLEALNLGLPSCFANDEEVSEPPVSDLETAVPQLSVQRITLRELHQEVVRLKSELVQATAATAVAGAGATASATATAAERKVGEAGYESDLVVKAISPEEYAHYLELCDFLVRKNVCLEKQVEAMERKIRGLQKPVEACKAGSPESASENDLGQEQGSPLGKQNRLGRSLVESGYQSQKGGSERCVLQELRSGSQNPSASPQASLRWQNSKLQSSISRG